ncbi:williams-beuren syndrome critical region [Moniliophthora roreri MCA 2997]|uniref:Williams-beuren syndrome critical region n=1 Tax=Moniliophthora roreri (strain MCA 2997) TaxID=1381753 RepID=V2X9B2_MONRO|nr:williams-beuren syndrome critical region [Moniliophthora roreri MCA 2997]
MSSDISTPFTNDFPELAHLSRQDLEDLLNDHTYFQAIFHSLPRVKAMYEAQADLGMANETIAKNNLSTQDSLYALRAETQAAFDEAKALEARWKDLEKEQRDIYQRFTPQFLLMRLRHSTTAQDDASEALASAFIHQQPSEPGSGTSTPAGKDIDEFIKEFKELRKVYHKRVMWGDQSSQGRVEWRDD